MPGDPHLHDHLGEAAKRGSFHDDEVFVGLLGITRHPTMPSSGSTMGCLRAIKMVKTEIACAMESTRTVACPTLPFCNTPSPHEKPYEISMPSAAGSSEGVPKVPHLAES